MKGNKGENQLCKNCRADLRFLFAFASSVLTYVKKRCFFFHHAAYMKGVLEYQWTCNCVLYTRDSRLNDYTFSYFMRGM